MKGARRFLAVTLLALVHFSLASFPLISVAFVSDEDSKLPACCRRNGKHQCSMSARSRAGSPSGPAFEAAPCPMFPGVQAAPAGMKSGLVPDTAQVAAAPAVVSMVCVRSGLFRGSKANLATGIRGPPPQRA